jgi:hypothetical protein
MGEVRKRYPRADFRGLHVVEDVVCGEAQREPGGQWRRFYSTGTGVVWYTGPGVNKLFKGVCG